MDPRVDEHARILVEHCIDVQAGDEVIIAAPSEADDLVVALYKHIGQRGAVPCRIGSLGQSQAQRAFMCAMNPEEYDTVPEAQLALAENADCAIGIQATSNTHQTSDVAPDKQAQYQQLFKPVQNEIMDLRWVGTQYPASGNAQDAEMSTPAYEDFVYDAITIDWNAQRELQANLVEILEDASDVRIVSGEKTDLTLSIDGMHTVNDDGQKNLPGGEVFTAPVPDTVSGDVYFDLPVMWQGKKIEGTHLVFEDGEVVEHTADTNAELLTEILAMDEHASQLGELGFGMNRDIDRFTRNMLFDEKMGDTIHLALGRAYEETVGDNREQNDSALHLDMIVDMSQDSYVEVDGEVIQRDGVFVFEDNR